MFAILSTFVLDLYLILVSAQVSGVTETRGIRLYLLIFLILEFCLLLLLQGRSNGSFKIDSKDLTFISIIYLIFIGLCLMVSNLSVNQILEIAFFPLIILIISTNYSFIHNLKTFDRIMDMQFYLLLILFVVFLKTQIQDHGEYENNVNTIYYLVFTFPFVDFHKTKVKRIIGLALITFCVFWSMKRAAIIALAAAFYFTFRDRVKTKSGQNLIRVLVAFALVFAADAFFEKYYGRSIVDRLLTLGSDGGSGRTTLAMETLDLLKRNTPLQWLFGHKLVKTAVATNGLGAHNDFLEVLYRMGLAGFAIFLCFFRAIWYHKKKCAATGNEADSKMLSATFWLFLIVSFSSQLFYLPSYIALVGLASAFAVRRTELTNRLQMGRGPSSSGPTSSHI